MESKKYAHFWIFLIFLLIAGISAGHYATPTAKWQYHLIFMEAYFIPIIIAAFQFGVKGGLISAIAVSLFYFPHIMLQWGGLVESNLMRFMQIVLFNVIGYVTGLKAQAERREKERYQQAATELEASLQKLKEQSEQLSEMEEQLRFADRLAVIGELTASLAHEVRNPLGAIRGATEILRDELPAHAKSSEFLQVLIEETQRLNQVVENYLNLARRTKRQRTIFELTGVINAVTDLLRYSARRAGVTCRTQLPAQPLFIQGDPNHLQQILINVCLNALQAMPNGGELQISLDIAKHTNPETVQLTVNDTGTGMSQDQLEKAVQAFYTTKPTGSGLGLSIVRRLVQENNWGIAIDSEPGRGTTVRLHFERHLAEEERNNEASSD